MLDHIVQKNEAMESFSSSLTSSFIGCPCVCYCKYVYDYREKGIYDLSRIYVYNISV